MIVDETTMWGVALMTALGLAVEAALGFGATLITVAGGSLFLPVSDVLLLYLPANIALSAFVGWMERRSIQRRFLFGTLLPWMSIGTVLGLAGAGVISDDALRRGLGAGLAVLAGFELTGRGGAARALSAPRARVLLILGGVVHGAVGSGGPLAVYVASRSGLDKSAFRGTLAVAWLVLNAALLVALVARAPEPGWVPARSLVLAPSVLIGLAAGGWLHRHLPEARFRTAVYALLLLVAVALLARP